MKKLLLALFCLLGVTASMLAEDSTTYTDNITNAVTGITTTSYKSFSNKSKSTNPTLISSEAVYSGLVAGNSAYIQINKNKGCKINNTASGGVIQSITFNWNTSSSSSSNSLKVYGSNTALTSATGTELGSVSPTGTSTITPTQDYEYFYIDQPNGVLYIDQITIVWKEPSAVSKPAAPTFSLDGTALTAAADNNYAANFTESASIGISSAGGAIYYTTNDSYTTAEDIKTYGSLWTDSSTLSVTESSVVRAVVYDSSLAENQYSDVATLTLTKKVNTGSLVDHLTSTVTGVTNSSYTSFSNKSKTSHPDNIKSDAVYAGKVAGSNSYIQLNNTSGNDIRNTASGGLLQNITVNWDNTTNNSRSITIYGGNEALTSSNLTSKGTSLGTLSYSTSGSSLDVTGEYTYFYIKASGALYLNDIYITWGEPSTTRPLEPVFSPVSGTALKNYGAGQNNTITITSERADRIAYRIGETTETLDATDNSISVLINSDCTITAWGINSETSETGPEASATYTIASAPSTPTISVASGEVRKGTEVTIAAENASQIKYTVTVGETTSEPTTVAAPATVTITEGCTIQAWGVNAAGDQSETSATATYTILKPVAEAVFTPASGSSLAYNGTVTVGISDAESIKYQIGSADPVTVERNTATFSLNASCTVTVWGLISGAEGNPYTATYTVAQPEMRTYTLVTSLDDISVNGSIDSGLHFVIANKNTADDGLAVNSTANTSNGALGAASITVVQDKTNDSLTISVMDNNEDVGDFMIVPGYDEGKYALQYTKGSSAGKYLIIGSNTTSFNSSDTKSTSTDLEITLETGNFIKIKGVSSKRYIRNYNSEFRAYSADNGNAVYLYVLGNATNVSDPSIITSLEADEDGYFNNEITLTPTCLTSNAVFKYSTDYDEENPEVATWMNVPATWTLNTPATFYIQATKEGLTDSNVVMKEFKFRPAPVIFSKSIDQDTRAITLSMSSATTGAEITYKVNDGEWQTYNASNPPVFEGIDNTFTVVAKATYTGYDPNEVETTTSFTITESGDEVFELVTSSDVLHQNDRIIVVNQLPFNEKYYAMTGNKVSGKNYVAAEEIKILSEKTEEVLNEETQETETRLVSRTVLVPEGSEICVMTLEKWSDDATEKHPWLLKTEQIEEVGGVATEVDKYVYCPGNRLIGFQDLPDADKRYTIQVKINVDEAPTDFGAYRGSGSSYNTNNEDKEVLYNRGTVVISTPSNEGSGTDRGNVVARFNPSGTVPHFNFYGYNEESDEPNPNTWPVQIYRSTSQVLAPSLTVYSKKVYVDQDPDEYETTAVSPSVVTFYNPVKVVITENPRTRNGAELNYHWNKADGVVPVSSEYTAVDGSAVKGAEVEMFVDGFNAYYYDLAETPVRHDIDLSTLDAEADFLKADFRVMSSLGELDSRPQFRQIRFKTTAPVLERKEIEVVGVKKTVVYVHRPEVFTKGATLHYTTDGTAPTEGSPTVEPEGYIELTENATLRVAAFKAGYETSEATLSDLTVYPYARPIQLLELRQSGLDKFLAVTTGATVTTNERTSLKLDANGKMTTNKVYLTHRTVADRSYYLVAYDVNATTKEVENIVLVDVDNATAMEVIQNPEYFRWTSDYYVYGMRLDEFNSAVPYYDKETAEMTIHDSSSSTRVLPTEFELYNAETGDTETVTYYGTVLLRNGSLGADALWTEFDYDAKKNEGDDYTSYHTEAVNQLTPAMPVPFDLNYSYTTVRDDSAETDTPEDDYEFNTGTSVDGVDVTNTLIFPKEKFALRHFDCEFTFNRPNVCDEISDNYDIIYDITVTTNTSLEDVTTKTISGKFVDNTTSSEINAMEADNNLYEYKFAIKDVHPNSGVTPNITINKVTYIPRNEDSDFAQLKANYIGEGPATTPDLLDMYDQTLTAPNATTASQPNVAFKIYPVTNNGKTDWYIANHTNVKNTGAAVHTDVNLEAPFMYHVEAVYTGGDEGDQKHYISYNTLVEHSANYCESPGYNIDPFKDIKVGEGYNSESHYPTIYVTPIYFFKRMPEADVTNESALVSYEEYLEPTNAPAVESPTSAPRRAAALPSEIVVMRGSNAGTFTPTDESITTGIEDIDADETDARYYNLQGIQISKEQATGLHIKVDGKRSTKILKK